MVWSLAYNAFVSLLPLLLLLLAIAATAQSPGRLVIGIGSALLPL